MTSLPRRVARRVLPLRVRAAGLALLDPPQPPAKAARTAPAKPPKRAKAKRRPTRARVARPAAKPAWAPSATVKVLSSGGTLAAALLAEARRLLKERPETALAMAVTLRDDPDTVDLGRLLEGVVTFADEHHALAWSALSELPESLWARYAAREFARSGLAVAPEETIRRIEDLVERAPADLPAHTWLDLLGPVFGHGDHALVVRLFAHFDTAVGDGSSVDEALVIQRDWLRPWVSTTPDGASAPAAPEGAVSFAVMAYGHPGRSRASANIGDHVQSIASLGHLARHQGFDYDGPQDLVDLLTLLRGRVRPELARTEATGRIQLLQIDRDASAYAAIPPQTWTLAFGWYMHALFETRYGFPFHPNLLPLFVSFHCSKRDLLTDEAIDYLRRYAPIGCRDWTTVDILLSVGVPAFFSGCLTTTVRTVFPQRAEELSDGPVAYVDMPKATVPKGAPTYAHSNDAIRFRSFAHNMGDALELLETYRREHHGVVTSRLHCYLPVRSLGVPADFQPGNRSDPRFAGLIDITDAEFAAIQTRIDTRLEAAITAIAAGDTPEQVYALWRELNADDVARALQRRSADHPLPAVRSGLLGDVATVRGLVDPLAPQVPVVVVAVPNGSAEAATRLLASTAAATTGPLQFVLLSRDAAALDTGALSTATGGRSVQVVDLSGIGRDLRAADREVSDGDVARLAVPELLDVDRVIILPVDAVVSGDLTELADFDLEGRLLAAPPVAGRQQASGYAVLNGAANRLEGATTAAAELRRRYSRHHFDFDAFGTDVLVLNTARWRAEGFTERSLALIEEFGLTYHELLHFLAGPDRAELPGRWHQVPGRSVITEPALVHWSGEIKPWSAERAPERDRWHA